MIRIIKFSTPAILMILLIACAGSNKKKVVESEYIPMPDYIYLDTKKLKTCNVALSGIGYDGLALSNSLYQANINASLNSPPGAYSPEAGLAGALIAGAIIKSIEQSKAQKNKNEPIKTWLTKIEVSNLDMHFLEILTDSTMLPVETIKKKTKGHILKLTPSLNLTANYGSLELHVLAEVVSPQDKLLYRNYFHIQSQSLLQGGESLKDLNLRNSDNAKLLLSEIIKKFPALVLNELKNNASVRQVKSIRFENHMGKYFEMGHIMSLADEDYITFRTLRGEVKHYPIMQSSLEQLRLLIP